LDSSFGTVACIIKVARACARIVFGLAARHQSIAWPGRARSSTGAKGSYRRRRDASAAPLPHGWQV